MKANVTIFNRLRECDHSVPLDGTKCNSCDRLYLWYGIRNGLLFVIPLWIIIGLILIGWVR